MSEYDPDLGKEAKRAFSSPTNLTAQKIGFRVAANSSPSGGASVSSARSRRSASIITTPDEADLFDQMTKATSIKVRMKKDKVSNNLFSGATSSILQSFSHQDGASETSRASPISPQGSTYSAGYYGENYFSPGGPLAIPAPGRPTDEKDFDWNKRHEQSRKRNASPTDEKKAVDDGDNALAKSSAQSISPTGLDDTEENKKVLSSIFRQSQEGLPADSHHQPKSPVSTYGSDNDWTTAASETATRADSIGKTETNDSRTSPLQHTSSARKEESSPLHSVVQVETVDEKLDAGDYDGVGVNAEVASMKQASVAPPIETKSFENQNNEAEANDVLQLDLVNSISTTIQQEQPAISPREGPYQDATENNNSVQYPVIDNLSAVESDSQLQRDMTQDPDVVKQEKEEVQSKKIPVAPETQNAVERGLSVFNSEHTGHESEQNTGPLHTMPEFEIGAGTDHEGTTTNVDLLGWTEPKVGATVKEEQPVLTGPQKDADAGGLVESKQHHETDLLDFTHWKTEASAHENLTDSNQQQKADAHDERATQNMIASRIGTVLHQSINVEPQDEAITKTLDSAGANTGTALTSCGDEEQNEKFENKVLVGSDSRQEQAKDLVDCTSPDVATPCGEHFSVETENDLDHMPGIEKGPQTDPLDPVTPSTAISAPEYEPNVNSTNPPIEPNENPEVQDISMSTAKTGAVIRNNSILETSPPCVEKEATKTNSGSEFDLLQVDPGAPPSEASSRQTTERITSKMDSGGVATSNPMVPDPCGMASETFENIGSFIGQRSPADKNIQDVERDAICSVVSDPESQQRISELVASFSSTIAAVGLTNDYDGTCSSPCHEDYKIDLRSEDDEFRLIAQNTVAFLQSRLDEGNFTITIKPSDRKMATDILPTSIRYQFFDALRYRLSRAPNQPKSDLDFLVLKCQELGLDVEGEKNPMLAAVSNIEYPLSFDVLHILENKKSRKNNEEVGKMSTGSFGELVESKRSSNEADGKESGENETANLLPFASPVSASTKASQNEEKPLAVDVPPSNSAVESRSDANVNASPFMTTPQGGSIPEGKGSEKKLSDPFESHTSEGQKGALSRGVSAFVPLNNASQPGSDGAPSTGSLKPSRLPESQADKQPVYSRAGGPPSKTSHQIHPNPSSTPRVGEYYAMDDDNAQHHYIPDKTQSSKMQALEYESRMVDVIAPADLPGGYHFEAEIEGQRFLATVPVGGVQQGETFTCYMRELNSVAIDIPVGYWKDNMCHMCKHGLCHPTLWHALFCPLVALGQITHRLQLDFLGRPRYPGVEQSYSNRFMMLSVTICWLFLNIALLYAGNYKWMRAMEITAADYSAFALVNVCIYGFAVFVAQSTRSSIREKFMIREERCYDLEDIMCASTCLPCTVAQMARHTANYDDYEAVCCSKTGLPDGVTVKHTSDVKEDEHCFV